MATKSDVDRMRVIGARLLAAGVEILWVPGWEGRGKDWTRIPVGVADHHDASTIKSGEWGALGIIRDGRGGTDPVPGPLAQFQVARCRDGRPRVAIVAAGRANHAGKGGPLWTIPRDGGNAWLYGVECANNGTGEPYTAAAVSARTAVLRAARDVCGFGTAHVIGHKEWAPGRKFDPSYDMGWQRSLITPTRPPTPARPVLQQGSTGDLVEQVQTFLRRVFPSYAGGLVADGDFGPATAAVVREFQRRSGLDADGVIGPASWTALERSGYR